MIELRPYQVDLVNRTHTALREVPKVCVCAPTGSGKRKMAVWWATQICLKYGKRILVVTDRRQLVRQMADECKEQNLDYGVVMGDTPTNRRAPIQVASIQTLYRREYQDLPVAAWVMWDEAHKMLPRQKELMAKYPNNKFVGFSATPVTPNGYTLEGLYDRVIEGVKNSQLIGDGFLLPTTVWHPSEPDLKTVVVRRDGVPGVAVSKNGEFNQKQLAAAVEQCTVFADVFSWWEPYCHMQTIVFAPRVKYARGLAEQFISRGHQAEVISGSSTATERKDILARFGSGETHVLCSVDVLREGFDYPIAQCGIDLQPNRQLRTFWQKVGRVRRPYGDQKEAVWLDFAGNYWRFPHPNEDPNWMAVSGKVSMRDLLRQERESGERKPWTCPECAYCLMPGDRIWGGICPNCGTEIKRATRRIRMKGGRLVKMGEKVKKKKKYSSDQKRWDACRYIAMHSRKTLNFARWLYKHGNNIGCGRWPDRDGLKYCPPSGSLDWKRKPQEVYPWMRKKQEVYPWMRKKLVRK